MLEEPLALYVVEDEPPRGHDGTGKRLHAVLDGVVALSRAVVDGPELLGAPTSHQNAGGPMVVDRHWLDRVIIRHLLIHPARAQAAFDRWLEETAGCVVTRVASLRLAPPVAPDPVRLRVVPAHLDLRHSPFRVPVELELVAWGGWRTAIGLRPVRRRPTTAAWRVSNRYFAAAHAVLDAVVDTLRSDVEHAP